MNQEKWKAIDQLIRSQYKNIAGIVVQKNGERLYENYFNGCEETSRIHVYSVTKSVISILVGIAVDKGYIKDIDQKILDFYPDFTVKKKEHTIQNITIKNLLTMTAPYKYKLPPYIRYFTSEDSVIFSLNLLGGKGQIGEFRYTPLIGPDILSGILVKATGQTVFQFAAEHLFEPLGITVENSIVLSSAKEQTAFNKSTNRSGWVMDGKGINTAGWGLTLSAADMGKIGALYLDCGMWNGNTVVSKEWIEESTKEHSRWDKMNLPYGYLWWVMDEKDHIFAAMGDGGNVIYVNAKEKIVISIASLFTSHAKDRIELIKNNIEPTCMD